MDKKLVISIVVFLFLISLTLIIVQRVEIKKERSKIVDLPMAHKDVPFMDPRKGHVDEKQESRLMKIVADIRNNALDFNNLSKEDKQVASMLLYQPKSQEMLNDNPFLGLPLEKKAEILELMQAIGRGEVDPSTLSEFQIRIIGQLFSFSAKMAKDNLEAKGVDVEAMMKEAGPQMQMMRETKD